MDHYFRREECKEHAERELLFLILERQGAIMAAIDTLNQAVVDVSTAISAISADVTAALALLKSGAGGNDAAITAAAATLESAVANLNAVDATLKAAVGSGGPPPPPPNFPVINSFVVTPVSGPANSNAVLSWSVTGATSLSIDNGVGDVTSAPNATVTPAATTAYTLTATNVAGSSTAMVTFIVA